MTNIVVSSQSIVGELHELAARLNELGLHEEGTSVTQKADALKQSKPILSKRTLQERIDSSMKLEDLKKRLRKGFLYGVHLHSRSTDSPTIVLGILADALVEVVTLADGTLSSREANILTCRRMSIPLSWMDSVEAFAYAEDMLIMGELGEVCLSNV